MCGAACGGAGRLPGGQLGGSGGAAKPLEAGPERVCVSPAGRCADVNASYLRTGSGLLRTPVSVLGVGSRDSAQAYCPGCSGRL